MVKYQWLGEIQKDESMPQILPFLDYSKSFGNIKKGTNKIYFSLRDRTQKKRLPKLDIIRIK